MTALCLNSRRMSSNGITSLVHTKGLGQTRLVSAALGISPVYGQERRNQGPPLGRVRWIPEYPRTHLPERTRDVACSALGTRVRPRPVLDSPCRRGRVSVQRSPVRGLGALIPVAARRRRHLPRPGVRWGEVSRGQGGAHSPRLRSTRSPPPPPCAGAARRARGAGITSPVRRSCARATAAAAPGCRGLQCGPAHARWREAPRRPAAVGARRRRRGGVEGTPGPGCCCAAAAGGAGAGGSVRQCRRAAGAGLRAGSGARRGNAGGQRQRGARWAASAARGGAGGPAGPRCAVARGRRGRGAEGSGGSLTAPACVSRRGPGGGSAAAALGRARPRPGAGGARGAPARPGDPLCSCHNSRARRERCPPGPAPVNRARRAQDSAASPGPGRAAPDRAEPRAVPPPAAAAPRDGSSRGRRGDAPGPPSHARGRFPRRPCERGCLHGGPAGGRRSVPARPRALPAAGQLSALRGLGLRRRRERAPRSPCGRWAGAAGLRMHL